MVIARPEIRECEELKQPQRFKTRDGIVAGRKGDFAITAYGVERYPILRDIFLGAYEEIGRVGDDIVAKRLIHVRRAWEVLDDNATFDYGDGRGKVAVPRGSWLYQSDETDFGTTHYEVKHAGHVEAGAEASMSGIDWGGRRDRWVLMLGMLPCVLSLLALCAVLAPTIAPSWSWLAQALICLEVALLVAGGIAVVAIKRQRWMLKACVQSALDLGREFQAAARLLGQPESTHFPGMALWRAAQSPQPVSTADAHNLLQSLKAALAGRLHRLRQSMEQAHRREFLARWLTVAAVAVVLAANVSLIRGSHSVLAEFAVIWLPTVVAAMHGFDLRRRSAERLAAMRAFADELRFVQTRLYEREGASVEERGAVLVLLCRAAARYGQHELQLALAVEAPLPV